MAEPTYLYLTTRGRRTGRPREIEIWFTQAGGCYYVISEHGRQAHWVRNLIADPGARIRVGRRSVRVRARLLDGRREPTRQRAVRARSRAKYGWGDGLVVELRPRASAT